MEPTKKDQLTRLQEEVTDLRKTMVRDRIRLSMFERWVDFWQRAYEALLHHGVNFRTLKEYRDTEILDKAAAMPPEQGRNLVVRYINNLISAVDAAARRKQLKLVVDRKEAPKPEDHV